MQINFPTQEAKDEAIAEQIALNVTEEASAKAVYDKRVARGVKLLTDLQNATVGAVVPPADIAKIVAGLRAQVAFVSQDIGAIVSSVVTDPAVVANLNSQLAAEISEDLEAFAVAVQNGGILTGHF